MEKASKAILRKHQMLKMGKGATDKILSETVKTIVMPLKKLVDIYKPSTKKEVDQNEHVKKKDQEEKKDEDNISFMTADAEEGRDTSVFGEDDMAKPADNYNYLTNKFLRML